MSVFRNFRPRKVFACPFPIFKEKVVETPTENGGVSVSIQKVSAFDSSIPSPELYTFENITASGMPLSVVPSSIVDVEPDISVINQRVDSIINKTKND